MPKKLTKKFRLVPTKEQKASLNRWAAWTRKAYNYILAREYHELKKAMSQYTLISKYATEKKVNQYLGVEVKSIHVEGLIPKAVATLKTPEAKSTFIVGRTRVGSIKKEDGKYFFHVSDPFEKTVHDIRIHAKDQRGKPRVQEIEQFIDKEFPFEMHYSSARHFWVLHATTEDLEPPKVVSTRVMSVHVGIHNIVWAMVREERQCIYNYREKGGAIRQMSRWQRDYHLHKIASKLVSDARDLNASIVMEDLSFVQMMKNAGIEDVSVRALHRAMGRTSLSKFQDMVVQHAKKPSYVEGRPQPQVETEFVDGRYICRTCPKCGARSDEPEIHGKVFSCKCGYSNNYDFVASWNLSVRTIT